MTKVQDGACRDRRIVAAVGEWGSLSSEQVAALLFAPTHSGLVKAQQRLKRLHDAGRLSRCRPDAGMGYVYHVGKKSGQMEHRVCLNWARLWLTRRLVSWERLEKWEYEPDYGPVRPDGFAAARNTVTKGYRFMFVEMDRDAGDNAFDKVGKYTRLYATGGCRGEWWANLTDRWPATLVVTDSARRRAEIQKAVERDNVEGLRWDVRTLEDVKGEAMGR